MEIGFQVVDYSYLIPGLSNDQALEAFCEQSIDQVKFDGDVTYEKRLPMMTARRMSLGVRYACECALRLIEKYEIDALICSSRHGELIRGENLLKAIQADQDLSPTDFMMSVHNSAAGMFTINAKMTIPSTSIAAGRDSFINALTEAKAFLADNAKTVLVIDFESALPTMIGEGFAKPLANFAYATAWVLKADGRNNCTGQVQFDTAQDFAGFVPQSIAFLHGWANPKTQSFEVKGEHSRAVWTKRLAAGSQAQG